MEPAFSLKLGVDLVTGIAAGATVSTVGSHADLWPSTMLSLMIAVAFGLLTGYGYYKKLEEKNTP